MMEEISVADSAIEAASAGCVPRVLRVEELIFEADKNISRSGSYSSLSGDTSGRRNKSFWSSMFYGPASFHVWTIEEIFPVDFPHSILDLRMMIALGTYRSLGHMVIKSNFLTCLVASGFHQEGTKWKWNQNFKSPVSSLGSPSVTHVHIKLHTLCHTHTR